MSITKAAWWLLHSVKWHLSESTRCNHKVHPLHSEASAQLDCLNVAFSCSGERGKEKTHAEGIVDIPESINEGGVPFFDDVVQFIGRLVLLQSLHCRPFCFSISPLEFAYKYLVVSELCNDWLMQQKADVFEQVEGPRGRRALVHLLLVLGLMRVDAFKDAQSPENQRGMRNYLAVTWPLFGCVLS